VVETAGRPAGGARAARRLDAEAVGIVFAGRQSDPVLDKLPELVIEGPDEGEARLLLESSLVGPLDPVVREQLLAETHGNPLALLELPRGVSPADLAGGFALPSVMPLPDRIEESFRRRLAALSPATRRLLLLAAAEPTGSAWSPVPGPRRRAEAPSRPGRVRSTPFG
jgi:hypothetical protein